MLALYFILLVCVPLAIVTTFTAPRLAITIAVTKPAFLVIQNSNNTLTPPRVITSQPLDHDELLLRQASKVDPKPPPKLPKKLAFMFLTTTSLPFAPIWELFFNQTSDHHKSLYNVYIHVNPSEKLKPDFSGVFHNRIIPSSKPAYRNTPTLISAARRLLAHALLDDPSNYMFILLSPSCIPLHSFNFTYETLVSSTKSFIEILKDEPGWYDRWAACGPYAMLPEVPPEGFRIGSQFWTLTRAHARTVVSDVEIWSKFNKPCVRKDTCYPEEHYFATLLHMRDPQGCVSATLTHVDWSVSDHGHPRTYKPPEIGDGLIRKLRSARPRYGDESPTRKDPFLFARKFSPAGISQLMNIARNVIVLD